MLKSETVNKGRVGEHVPPLITGINLIFPLDKDAFVILAGTNAYGEHYTASLTRPMARRLRATLNQLAETDPSL